MKAVKGKWICKMFPKTASETFTKGRMVGVASGYVTNVADGSTNAMGIIKESVASTDSDFTLTTKVMVEIPTSAACVFEAAVTTALAVTDVGNYMDWEDSATIDETDSAVDNVLCVKYISSTKGWFVLNSFQGYRITAS